MEYKFDVISILLFFGALQGFILSGFLTAHKRGNREANRILAVILLFFSLIIALHTAIHTGIIKDIKFHAEIVQIFLLLINPHIYLYVKRMTDLSFDTKKKELHHAHPLIIGLILLLILFGDILSEQWIFIPKSIIFGLLVFQAIYYVFLANKILIEHSKKVKESYSNIEKKNLNWLRLFVIGYIIFMFVAFFIESFADSAHLYWNYGWLVVSVFIYLIGYFGLRQPEVFSGLIEIEKSSSPKYEKSRLAEEVVSKYLEKLEKLIVAEQPYLKPGLTLSSLAGELKIPSHHLSQIINQEFNQNFFDFINSKRIEEAKKRIIDPDYEHLNIAAICYEVGFNSTSAFNSAFKKHAGTTPSQYKKTILAKNS
jgi:AraC-like DNA-binding protein